MSTDKYYGYEKVIKDALVAARGHVMSSNDDKIQSLERKLETCKLTHTEIADIQKQLKQLHSR
jgi:hypothetical protein